MQVLIGIHSFNINGILKSALSFAKYLKSIDSSIVIYVNAPDEVQAGQKLFCEADCLVINYKNSDDILNYLNKLQVRIDLVFRESFFSPPLDKIATSFGAKYFIRNHDWLPLFSQSNEWFTAHKSAQDYFAESKGKNVIFVGEKVRQYYEEMSRENSIKEYVCYPTIDTQDLEKVQLVDDDEHFVILQLGTIYNRKGCMQTLEAFHLFLQKIENKTTPQLVFIGARFANERENSYIESLKAKVQELGLMNQVQILPTSPNPFQLIKNFNLLTLHSLSECTPLVIFESLYLGRPVVSSNVGAISDIITNEKNGYLFEYGCIQEQAELFCKVYANKNYWHAQAKSIRQQFEQNYSPHILNHKLKEIMGI